MILVDTDVLLIDTRYQNDPKHHVNRQALDEIRADGITLGITAQTLLEIVGILSFNVSPGDVSKLPAQLCSTYGLEVFPDPRYHPDYAGCTVGDLLGQMTQQMALGDAVQAIQIARHAPHGECLLSWNAKHFAGKLVIPALTPQEWLNQRASKP